MENSILPLLVRGEVGAIPIAPGEVPRQHTRDGYSCTQAFAVPRCTAPLPNPLLGQGEGMWRMRCDPDLVGNHEVSARCRARACGLVSRGHPGESGPERLHHLRVPSGV